MAEHVSPGFVSSRVGQEMVDEATCGSPGPGSGPRLVSCPPSLHSARAAPLTNISPASSRYQIQACRGCVLRSLLSISIIYPHQLCKVIFMNSNVILIKSVVLNLLHYFWFSELCKKRNYFILLWTDKFSATPRWLSRSFAFSSCNSWRNATQLHNETPWGIS